MVNNNNGIPIEVNKKPIELVQELKDEYKTPSYEEFLKNYESDGNFNYDDLSGGDIGTVKGYGPTTTQMLQTGTSFRLKIECLNSAGGGGTICVNTTTDAL